MSISNELDDAYRTLQAPDANRPAILDRIAEIVSRNLAPIEFAKAGVILKESGEYVLAASVLEKGLGRYPNDSRLYLERSIVARQSGGMGDADHWLWAGLRSASEPDLLLREAVVRVATGVAGKGTVSSEVAASLVAAASRSQDQYLRSACVHALQAAPRISRTLDAMREAQPVTAEEMRDRLRDAVTERAPFCFLRLGDGEGAILQGLRPDIYPPFAKENHQQFEKRWFGKSDAEVHQKVLRIAAELSERLSEADVLGVPQINWIEGLAKRKQLQPMFNALEATAFALEAGAIRTADVGVCLMMEQKAMLLEVVKSAGEIDLITSRADLGGLLSQLHGIKVNQTHLIPPPASDPSSREGEMGRGNQLFGRFDEMREALRATRPGDVVLIAAGFLGKIYALDIKARGGIAIDIGHVADRWVGYESRPESKGPNLVLAR